MMKWRLSYDDHNLAKESESDRLYGLMGLNHHILEKMCVVAPLTDIQRRT